MLNAILRIRDLGFEPGAILSYLFYGFCSQGEFVF
jgi:hypothetical protein